MWIWIIIIAVVIGAIISYLQSGKGEDAASGALAGGCLAAGCLVRIFIAGIILIGIIWLFDVLF